MLITHSFGMPNNFTVDEDDKNQPIDIDNLIDSNTSVVKFSRKMVSLKEFIQIILK